MAFMECEFKSGVLGKACRMNVLVPQKTALIPGRRNLADCRREYRVLYLLHGLSDDHSMWCRRTSIERYAEIYDLVVVMPDGGRSFYTDMRTGEQYWTFLSEELPEAVVSMFPVSARREDTFAAGLSMGGYGALKLGLRCPERFAAVGSLSSVTDIRHRMTAEDTKGWRREFANIFGSAECLIPDGNDLFDLAERARSGSVLPRIISICGTEDFMYQDNLRFRDRLLELKWPEYRFEEHPGGHSWEFWDLYIQTILKFMFETGEKACVNS